MLLKILLLSKVPQIKLVTPDLITPQCKPELKNSELGNLRLEKTLLMEQQVEKILSFNSSSMMESQIEDIEPTSLNLSLTFSDLGVQVT
jgi:hypothetical protein